MNRLAGDEDPIRVLHVDDDAGFAETAAAFVEEVNGRIEVETATSADEAVARLATAPVDCVVSDYDMPGGTGLDLLAAVRESYPDLPFVLFTGKGSEEVASEAISAGVTDYLQKSFGTDQYDLLAHRITNAVTAARASARAEHRRHRLEQILKTVPGCVTQLDVDGRFTYANRRAREVLGLERSAVTARTYDDPRWHIRDCAGDPIPDEELPFRRILDSGQPVSGFQHTIEWPDGTRKVLVVNGAPLFDDRGTVESVVFSLTDVTDRCERERTLTETRRNLQLVLEATGTGVWEWDLETDAVRWTETLERVMGLTPGSFGGTFEAFTDLILPVDLPAVRSELERAVETDGTYEAEFRMRHADGDVRWVAARGKLVDDDGESVRMVGVHQDVTHRRRLQSELAAALERYRHLVENIPQDGVFLYDEDLTCVLAGGSGLDDVGLDPADVVGASPSERFPEPIAAEIEAALGDACEGRTSEFEQSYRDREYRVWTLPVEGPDGSVDRVMAVSREITDQKRRERELREQKARLAEFAGVVSHDLRTPLGTATARLALAREELDSDHLVALDTVLTRMERIVEDVLSLARAGRALGRVERVDLRHTVEAAWELTADGCEDAELVVTDEGPESVGTVRADPSRLRHLLENVLRNAIDHGGEDVTVTVHLREDGFVVDDDGPGVPHDERAEAFTAGYSTAGGAGFGLHIVQQVAAAHGWDVSLCDSPSGGTRVR
ncbi:PAS domain S-box protein, partial [Salinigranum sp.]|uniref:hybrid sensor histidine kinase/response regulator n=1 Tax=Salinigranum sp. TaxID=1966351 RepID=UPI0035681154